MEGICSQLFLIEYLEKHNFLKIANANSIFAYVKSITQLLCWHFFADMKQFELERLVLFEIFIFSFIKCRVLFFLYMTKIDLFSISIFILFVLFCIPGTCFLQ